jgi:DNA-binding response OmpR family regulator
MNAGILIVEDESLIALDLKRELEHAGFTVVMIADNADEALLNVERLRPALVLMDIRLHGDQDGIETADLIRRNFHIPVMFVTALADRETISRARITGPFDYIVKPYHGVDFRDRIETAIGEHKRTERLRLAIEQQKRPGP